jgi:uncharacterized FlaG/YvyC family protein
MDVPAVGPVSGPAQDVQEGTGTGGSAQSQATAAAAASSAPNAAAASSNDSSALASVVAKLYNVPGSQSNDANIGVSYKVIPGLDLVVTVFTNADTGEEIAQFPPELLVGVAQFFDQLDGVTLDKKV